MEVGMKARHLRTLVAGFAATSFFATIANAGVIIGVDFDNGGATNQSPGSSAVVGPYASAGWSANNELDTSNGGTDTITLTDSNGSLTTATFGFKQGGTTLSGQNIYNSSY